MVLRTQCQKPRQQSKPGGGRAPSAGQTAPRRPCSQTKEEAKGAALRATGTPLYGSPGASRGQYHYPASL